MGKGKGGRGWKIEDRMEGRKRRKEGEIELERHGLRWEKGGVETGMKI